MLCSVSHESNAGKTFVSQVAESFGIADEFSAKEQNILGFRIFFHLILIFFVFPRSYQLTNDTKVDLNMKYAAQIRNNKLFLNTKNHTSESRILLKLWELCSSTE